MTLQQLIERGFDSSEHTEYGLHIGCSQCAALCINGVPCHEHGCPNQKGECKECGARIPKGHRLCDDCANPEPEDIDPGDRSSAFRND